jgi:hypothetical protein
MPPILFPASSAPGKDFVEGSGRLVNAYSEKLQDGAPAQYVIRRAPGLTEFGSVDDSNIRGQWFDGDSFIYAVWDDGLYYIDSSGEATFIESLPLARLTFLTSEVDASDATIYTYEDVAFGNAHFNRRIIVAVMHDATNDAQATVTIGGVAATRAATAAGTGALFIASVPTGTEGDIVVTYASAASRSAIGVWRADGLLDNTPFATRTAFESGAGAAGSFLLVPATGAIAIGLAKATAPITWGQYSGSIAYDPLIEDFEDEVEATWYFGGASLIDPPGGDTAVGASIPVASGNTAGLVMASWPVITNNPVTFAKNNKAPTPDQVLCTPSRGAYAFTTSGLTPIDVNSELPNSVCYGDGFFFFTTPGGLCYASGINATTVNSLDVIRAEARAEPLVRGVFWNGELYLFGQTHTEVWASNGNPNATGFPLNRTTVVWRGLIATLAVCGFEEGFEGGLIFVADDNSVRLMAGYQPQTISTPDVERAIEACTNKTAIRCFVYDVGAHACVAVDLAGEATWVYDLTEGGRWHERKSDDADAWRLTGNSVRAFGKWIAGDRSSGSLYQIDASVYDEDGDPLTFVAESIAMEAFPQRLQVPRADFNFGMGVGTDDVEDPKVKIQWSDDGGHTWSDPLTASLGEKGRRKMQVRKNRLGLTGVKGRRFRLTVDDPVYVALLAGSMEVEARR